MTARLEVPVWVRLSEAERRAAAHLVVPPEPMIRLVAVGGVIGDAPFSQLDRLIRCNRGLIPQRLRGALR